MSNASYVVGNFMTDGLLLYRTFVVWNKSYQVVILPGLLYMGSTAISMLSLYETAQPGASLWTQTSLNVTLTYFSMSISLNTLLTLLIAGRVLFMRKRVTERLGLRHARTYTSIAAMVLESAFPYTAFGIAFVTTYAVNNPSQNVLLPILSQVMCMSPELIIWRVALGRAWNEHTTSPSFHTAGNSGNFPLAKLRFRSSTTRVDSDVTANVAAPSMSHFGSESKSNIGSTRFES